MHAIGPRLRALRRLGVAFSVGFLALGACAPTTVETQEDHGGSAFPYPDRVIVYNFATSPDEVELDQGLSAELVRSFQSASTTEQERIAGRQVARAIAGTLVEEISNTGLTVESAQESPPFSDNVVLIKGQILSIDEGNRTLRALIGLGAGRTAVEADAQVLYLVQGTTTPRLIENMQAAAKSDRLPGIGETLFPGEFVINLATGEVGAVADETFGANVKADGKRMGRQIADHVVTIFANQGWIVSPQ